MYRFVLPRPSEVVSARLARAVHLFAYGRQSAVAYKTAGSKCEILWLTTSLGTFLLKMLQAILTAAAVLGLLFVREGKETVVAFFQSHFYLELMSVVVSTKFQV